MKRLVILLVFVSMVLSCATIKVGEDSYTKAKLYKSAYIKLGNILSSSMRLYIAAIGDDIFLGGNYANSTNFTILDNEYFLLRDSNGVETKVYYTEDYTEYKNSGSYRWSMGVYTVPFLLQINEKLDDYTDVRITTNDFIEHFEISEKDLEKLRDLHKEILDLIK